MSQRSPLTKKSEAPVRNRIFPAISGNKDHLTVHALITWLTIH